MEKTPKRPKRYQLLIKASEKDHSALEDFIAIAQHFPTHYEALKYLNSLGKCSPVVEFQQCERFSEIPNNPNYIECRITNEKGKTVDTSIRQKQYCFYGCKSSSIVKVELNQQAKRERLKVEISILEDKKKGLTDEIKELEPKKAELTSKVNKLESEIKNLIKLKGNYETEIKEKVEILEGLTEKIKDFEEQETQLSKIEPLTRAEPQENAELPAMKTSIETERTTERVIEKQKIVQEPMLPDIFEGKKILCPTTKDYVSITEQCKRKCLDAITCEFYLSINEGKIPEGAKIT
jgi:hypothetical protein